MRKISIKRKFLIFKTSAISKIVHLALVKEMPSNTITQLNKMQGEFIWKNGNPNIKPSTLCNDFENVGLKNVDMFSKITTLQCSWAKRLYDPNFHSSKVIPSFLIKSYQGHNFLFHIKLNVV